MSTLNNYRASSIARSHDQYRIMELSSKLESADPHGLVSILYDELMRSLDIVAAMLKPGCIGLLTVHVTRAKSILLALAGSLDFEEGREIAEILSPIYRAMILQIGQIVETNDTARLSELRSGLRDISAAWNALKPSNA
jgi:flagellar secretion chaperone FliS